MASTFHRLTATSPCPFVLLRALRATAITSQSQHLTAQHAVMPFQLKAAFVSCDTQVNFKEPTPAGEELIVRSQVVDIRDRQPRGAKSQVTTGTRC